ncbi:MAG TPA: TonB-dependent receptor [Sphingomicrobium sp.]|nr:TonB-dependent receptor [Sphingomicrobium sp.]
MPNKSLLLSGAAFLLLTAAANAQDSTQQPAVNQQQAQPEAGESEIIPDDEEDGQTVVVTGAKPRGSAIGDIPPEETLTSRDVQATGATDINELLEALAPQIGSARGRGGERPVMLLNGKRVSGFRELRDIPTEAISRVDILPEEVALKYGYPANQKVVNIVLRPRFQSTAALLSGKAATGGGYAGATGDVTRLMIGEKGRTSVNLHAEGNGMLTENERDILVEQPPEGADIDDVQAARSLLGSGRELRGAVTVNRELGQVGATGNIELEHSEGRSLIGLGDTLVEPLARNTAADSAHAGVALEGNLNAWRWSVTGNADAQRNVTRTDRDSVDVRDRAISKTLSGDLDATAHGHLFRLPAGDASATFKVGASTLHLDSDRRRNGVETSGSLGRSTGTASVNLDLPISRRNGDFGPLGNLSLNGNAEVEELSDFGTLTTIGAGANWSPAVGLNLIGSWSQEEGAPSVRQLGDPVLETPGARIFDFTRGETVLVTAITGGNSALAADRRNVFKLGANWRPFPDTDLRLRADYVHSKLERPISNFPGPTPTLEAAFPDRFVRDDDGNLVSVDLRPVNYDSARRDTLRIGFNFSKPLKSAPPSQAAIEAFRARRAGDGQSARTEGGPPPAEAGEGGRGPGGRGFGRFGGGRNGGRLTFSLTDTITLVDNVTVRDGLKLDYLRGDAVGQGGGRPRHEIEARAGYFNNGIGARVSADWRSGTQVRSASGDELHFSPVATFDLRLWANLGQKLDLVAKHPWLRGSSVRFQVDNIFDTKPKVRDAFGGVPLGYQPDLLDPLGRTVSITFRKLFLPPPSFFRRSESASGGGGED